MRYGVEFAAGGWEWAVAVAVAAACAWHFYRSTAPRALNALRAAGAAALLLALLRPEVVRRVPLLVKPKLLIAVDASHSMGGKAGKRTRLEAATRWLLEHRELIEKRADVVLFSVAGGSRRLSRWQELSAVTPGAAALNAGEALREAADDPAAASAQRAWLLTDGNAEPSSDFERAAEALKAPVDVLGVGPARRERGVSFVDLKTPDFAFLHGRFQVQAAVEASDLSGKPVAVRLLRERGGAGAASYAVIEEHTLIPGGDYESLTATFTATAERLGAERYRLEASAAGMAVRARDFRVEVIRQKYRIMYLSGRPSAEYAQLRELLKADPNHELVSFVILRNPENPSFVGDNELSLIPFPAEEIFVQNLSQFDLFILENFSYSRFRLPPSYLESLKAFVANGGGLLVIGGENAFVTGGYKSTAVEEMLPVTLTGATPDFTVGLFRAKPAARTHPLVQLYDTPEASQAAWDALPALDGFARFASVKPGATILAVHPQEKAGDGQPLPILAIREYGRGKVMLASSDSTWRWKLGAAADWRIGAFYARFWTRAVQYLTGSLDLSKVKFAPLPDRMPPREPAQFSLRVFDDSFRPAEKGAVDLALLWTKPDGKTREVIPQESAPGVYSIELTGLAPGPQALKAVAKYRGRPWGQDSVKFQWEAAAADAPMDRRWIKRAAEALGGSAAELVSTDAAALLSSLPPVREEAQISRRYHPAAAVPWLALAAGLLALEWALRRWRGLA
jgi:uncharacterized membrane protein